MKNLRFFFGLLIVTIFLAGCGSVLPKEALNEVNKEVDYSEIKANPNRYVGNTIILGGLILENNVSNEGTTLEVLKYTLDGQDRPKNPDEANGRFLAKTSRLLDPSIYKSGRLISMTGTFKGTEVKPLQKASYTYPVFEIDDLVLVPRSIYWGYYYPGYYYPYYYPYYDPFYWRYPYWSSYPYWW